MDGEDSKKIIDALASVGFEVKRIEQEKEYNEEVYTGALNIRIIRKGEGK